MAGWFNSGTTKGWFNNDQSQQLTSYNQDGSIVTQNAGFLKDSEGRPIAAYDMFTTSPSNETDYSKIMKKWKKGGQVTDQELNTIKERLAYFGVDVADDALPIEIISKYNDLLKEGTLSLDYMNGQSITGNLKNKTKKMTNQFSEYNK